MNARSGKWISSILMCAVGIALCVMWERQDILRDIIYLIGGLFVVTGIINMLVASRRRRKQIAGTGTTFIATTSGIGGICIGAAMLIIPTFFVGVIVYALAVYLILAGLWQIYILGYGFAPLKFPGWFYAFPVILVAGGVVIICAGSVRASANIVVLMTGIGIILYALTSFLELSMAGMNDHQQRKAAKLQEASVQESLPEREED